MTCIRITQYDNSTPELAASAMNSLVAELPPNDDVLKSAVIDGTAAEPLGGTDVPVYFSYVAPRETLTFALNGMLSAAGAGPLADAITAQLTRIS